MSSLVHGYQYDIFISYRHNDNRSGWVTEFVKNLQEELAATIKDPVSIYFDSNPHDGLHENHDVDDSLRDKLRSVILIPILSQTYCDIRSFAWKSEFLVFRQQAAEDSIGLKIKVGSGNVSSRILPVCIHDLDPSDKKLIEEELGGVLRGIDLIYKSQGVSRPLKVSEEDARGNLNHTYYRDQIVKVALAVKEILTAANNPGISQSPVQPSEHTSRVTPASRKKIAITAAVIGLLGLLSFTYYYLGGFGLVLSSEQDKSIAVLPFENMNRDPEQDYFNKGMSEDILTLLTKISDLKVKSLSSTLQYQGTNQSAKQIGEELGVSSILQGSVRRVGNTVRIVVKLIDARTDNQVWSETYDRELKDVLAVQSEIAIEVANGLQARLTSQEKDNIAKEMSENITAYDYFLRARELYNNTNLVKRDFENAFLLINRALELDPNFSRAYALKGNLWYNMIPFGVSQKIWKDSAIYFASKAISLDPKSPDGYLVKGYVNRALGEIDRSNSDFQSAYELAPNDPGAQLAYSRTLLRRQDAKGAVLMLRAVGMEHSLKDPEYYLQLSDVYYFTRDFAMQEKLLQKAKHLSPESINPYASLGGVYFRAGEYKKGIHEFELAEKINPGHQGIIDALGWLHYLNNDLEMAAKYWSRYSEIEATFEDSSQTVPFRHRLAMVYTKLGKKKEADWLVAEDLRIRTEMLAGMRSMGAWNNLGGVYYDMAVDQAYLGHEAIAVQYLDSAIQHYFTDPWYFHNDPVLDNLRGRDDFRKLIKKLDDLYEFLSTAFQDAINREQAGRELKSILK